MSHPVLILVAFCTFVGSIAAKPAYAQTRPTYPAACGQSRYVDPTEEQLRNFTCGPKNPKAGPYFQGDIRGGIPEDFYDRNGIKGKEYRWPDNTLVYKCEDKFTKEETGFILEAMNQITTATEGCIKFSVKANKDEYFARFKRPVPGGCESLIGFQKDNEGQVINLHPDCFNAEGDRTWTTAAHEIIHALGFFHEHTRPDRDDYVTVFWENIEGSLIVWSLRQ